jgi:hypothetical protein
MASLLVGWNIGPLHGWVSNVVAIGVLIGVACLVVMFILAFRTPLPGGPSPVEQERLPQEFDQDEGQ